LIIMQQVGNPGITGSSSVAAAPPLVYGWDLGGAHVKLAVLDSQQRLLRAEQAVCELWLGVQRLEAALLELLGEPPRGTLHAITMTGELTDVFADRAEGVRAIVDTFLRVTGVRDADVFVGGSFISAHDAAAVWPVVASANWQATAQLVAQLVQEALLIDIGSTTTDIAVVAAKKVHAHAGDDHKRLARDELVYSGVVRTPVMALARRVPFNGDWVELMAEQFATTGDLYRITGELDEAFDQAATADRRGRSAQESRRRLARMIGLDIDQASKQAWDRLARWLALTQRQRLRRACDRQLSRELLSDTAPVVGTGVGRFIAAQLARELGRPYLDFATLAGVASERVAAVDVCAPAYAVARLAVQPHWSAPVRLD